MKKLVLASNNSGKTKEMAASFSHLNIQLICQAELSVSTIEETGLTFVENAILKARHASQATNLPALADDSGLEVDILKGEPGIYSARYAGNQASDVDNIDKLISQLSLVNSSNFTARFRCVLVLLRHAHDPAPLISQGIWEGQITTHAKGHNGFGYDPIFFIPELNCTAAQLSLEQKNQYSHRAKALKKLIGLIKNHGLHLENK